jgi:serine/threonine-protein kinase RsbW
VVFVLDNNTLEIRIADQGNGTGTVDWHRRVVEAHNLDNEQLRGFGMHLIQALVDDCEIESSANGTVLTLRLHREEDLS